MGTDVETTNSIGMKMVLIPPGEFMMGSTDEQVEAALRSYTDNQSKHSIQMLERPQHRVVINKPFAIGATEVTIGEFRRFAEAERYVTEAEQYGFGESTEKLVNGIITDAQKTYNWRSPGYAVIDQSPVAQVTWNDAVAYCKWLTEHENRAYRLPSEAEWEYACRAGTAAQYSFGDDIALLEQYAWCNAKNEVRKSQPVALKLPNAFGLYDMHGNINEWCWDFFDADWYKKSSIHDPSGPASGPTHLLRGGNFRNDPLACRCAFRLNSPPSFRSQNSGFRCVREFDAESTTPTASPPILAKPITDINDPAFQQWMKDVQAMPADEQWKAVAKKLVELNPGFDGNVFDHDGRTGTPPIENNAVTRLGITNQSIADISPVRALIGLRLFTVNSWKVSDLSPLRGLSLTQLNCSGTRVSDFSPLHDMPLKSLSFNNCLNIKELSLINGMRPTEISFQGSSVIDLSPLAGMQLKVLTCDHSNVSDLSPLRGMPLMSLNLTDTQVSDLSPLEACKSLNTLYVRKTKATPASIAALQKALPNCKIDWDDPAKASKATKLFIHDPAFPQWMKDVQAMPAEEQLKAVSKKLMELNPGFDGKVQGADGKGTPTIENGVVTKLSIVTDHVTDISPVRSLLGLTTLKCNGNSYGTGKLSDLSPLKGMKLTFLDCNKTQVSDLSPLQGMPLTFFTFYDSKVSDLSPLAGMQLEHLDCGHMPQIADLSPIRGMPLKFFSCGETSVSDLSALRGMPLKMLFCHSSPVSNLSPLEDCQSLTTLDVKSTKVTAAGVAALQKALPNCKIEWDDPAKPSTPAPSSSSTK